MRILTPTLLADTNAAILALATHKLSDQGKSLFSKTDPVQAVDLPTAVDLFEAHVRNGLADAASVPNGFMTSHMLRLIHLYETMASGGTPRLEDGASTPESQEPTIVAHGAGRIDYKSPHVQTFVPIMEGPLVGALTFSAVNTINISPEEKAAHLFHLFLDVAIGKILIDQESGIATIVATSMQDSVVLYDGGLEIRHVILRAYVDDHQQRTHLRFALNAQKTMGKPGQTGTTSMVTRGETRTPFPGAARDQEDWDMDASQNDALSLMASAAREVLPEFRLHAGF